MPGVGVGERGAVEQQALVVLVRLQVTLVRDEIRGHGPTLPARALPAQIGQHRQHPAERMPHFADYEKNAAPREIPVILLDPEA